MSTTIRAEVSKNNDFWISKHRYYELKHFCMQYPLWHKILETIDGFAAHPDLQKDYIDCSDISDPTAKCAEIRQDYLDRIHMVEKAAETTDSVIGKYILMGVTQGIAYDMLRFKTDISCGKNAYYELYRKFFWILDGLRK